MVSKGKEMDEKSSRWVYAPIILAPIILFLPVLIPGKALFWGITSIQFIPWHWEALRTLQNGELPLWNIWNGMGAPLAANYQSAVFYPPTWLTLLAGWLGGLQAMAWSHGLLIVLHLIWAGWGMKKLSEFLGLHPIPQAICGLSFSLCGYFTARSSFLTMVQAAAWLPWIILAASRIAAPIRNEKNIEEKIQLQTAIPLALAFTGQWLSGHAQISWYSLLFCMAWLMTGALINGGVKKLLQIILPVGLAGVLAFLISSIQLVPTIEYFLQSQRSGIIDYQTALSYSFWPWRVITWIFPEIFGNPGRGDYWGYASFWEDAVYFGLLPFGLALYYIFKKKNDPSGSPIKPLFWFCIISSLIIFILALGWNTPVFIWLFKNVPTFGSFNGPTRWMILVEFCLILLAGLGANEWIKHSIISSKIINLSLAGMLALLLSTTAAIIYLPEIKFSFKFAMISAGLIACSYLVLIKLKSTMVSKWGIHRWQNAFVLLLAIDLIWAGSQLNPVVSSEIYLPEETSREQKINASGRYFISTVDERAQRFDRFFKFNDIRPVIDWNYLVRDYLPNSNIFSSQEMVNNFDPMLPDRYLDYLNTLESATPENREKLLSLANVTHVAKVPSKELSKIRWQKMEPFPSIRMVYCAVSVKNAGTALDWVKSAVRSDLLDKIVVEDHDSQQPHCDTTIQQSTVTIERIKKSTWQTISIKNNPAEGWLFLADSWYPGWRATVDGNPVSLFSADFAFMTLQVPAGDHIVQINYQPISFLIGTFFSIMGIIGAIIMKFVDKKSAGGSQ